MEEAVQRRSVVVPLVRRLLHLFVWYYVGGFVLCYLLAQVRYLAYRKHFKHLDSMEWLEYL